MGLVLDSSVLIASERRGWNARRTLAEVASHAPGEEVAMSVITVLEMAHGAARAETPERRSMRMQFLLELMGAIPLHSITPALALRAGEIDADTAARGVRIALSDLLIGVTALDLGYRVATTNLRHFQMIPGLQIVSF